RYNPAGYYVGPVSTASNLQPPSIILGSDRIPRVLYPGIGYQINPVTSAQYGLWAYDLYVRDHDVGHRRTFLHIANWRQSTRRETAGCTDSISFFTDWPLPSPGRRPWRRGRRCRC